MKREEESSDSETEASSSVGKVQRTKRLQRDRTMATYSSGVGALAINRLNEQNYKTWAVKAEMMLRKESLWRYIINPPAQPDDEELEQSENCLLYTSPSPRD